MPLGASRSHPEMHADTPLQFCSQLERFSQSTSFSHAANGVQQLALAHRVHWESRALTAHPVAAVPASARDPPPPPPMTAETGQLASRPEQSPRSGGRDAVAEHAVAASHPSTPAAGSLANRDALRPICSIEAPVRCENITARPAGATARPKAGPKVYANDAPPGASK